MLRFAPSPIGDMDIGDLRVAIFNYVVAQQQKDNFLVRIEDSNVKENIEGKDTEIMMLLEKFAIKHDSVYHQSEHLRIHQSLAIGLLKKNRAFICKCEEIEEDNCLNSCENLTQEEYSILKESGDKFVIRLKKPSEKSSMNSFVILEIDAKPSPIFASACDDMLSNINFIIEDEKNRNKSEKLEHIKSSLDYEIETKYLYLPTISNSDISIKSLFEEGFIPDAILNYLLLLGNPKAPKEIFTLPDAIEWFNLDTISKDSVEFDLEKLRYINQEHLKKIANRELSMLFGFADADIGQLAKLYLEEVSTTKELESKIRSIFKPKNFEVECGKEMLVIRDIIADAPYFETFNELEKHITQKSGLEGENLLKPLQILLTGEEKTPQLSEIYPFIKSYILEVAS